MKISEAFDLYKKDYAFYKITGVRTLQTHDLVLRKIIAAVGDKDIADLNMDDIRNWVVSIMDGTRCKNTVRNDIVRLRAVLKYARLRGYKCMDAELIPIPKKDDVTRDFLTSEEVDKMIDCACNVRAKFVISLLYSSGIRLAEFLSLNIGDIENGRFQVIGKGNKARLCFTDQRTLNLMDEYLSTRTDDSPALVVSMLHKDRMTPTNVQMLVKNAAKAAGIHKHVTPHVLRHSFATNFIGNNGNIRYLSAMLGHTSVATTMIYTHVVDNDLQEQYKKYHTV